MKTRPRINISKEPIGSLIIIKIEPISTGILFKNKPVFLQRKQRKSMSNSIRSMTPYRPTRLHKGMPIDPPTIPPRARIEIAIE
mgnify:FL=1